MMGGKEMSQRAEGRSPSDTSFLVQVPAEDLPDDFKRILEVIIQDARAKHLTASTIRIRTTTLARVLRWLSVQGVTEFQEVSPADLKAYVAQDTRGRNTVAMNCTVLRTMLRLLGRSDLADGVPVLAAKYEDDFEILTDEDISRMLGATNSLQWQTRLLLLYDAGARAGEVCNLRMKDVKLDNYGAQVTLRGKTGTRSRRLIKSVKLLETYLQAHRNRVQPDDPLFYAERRKKRHEPLKPSALLYMVQEMARRAGIEKDVWTHLVRHSAATSEASSFTDAELEELYGWKKGSGMPKRYRHKIDAHKLELKQLRLAGIQIPEEEMRSPLAPRICPRCSEQNTPLARFCSRCNMILDKKLAKEIQAREDKAKSILNILVNDKDFFDLMVQKIKEHGLDQS